MTSNKACSCRASRHVHAGRPGVPAPVMIKRNPIFHHLWRSEQYSAFAISQSKSDFHYQHIIRVPARLFALKSCSCCCCPLPFKLRLFRDPFLQSVLLWKLQSSLENGRCVSQDIMLPNYHFSRVLFCQNIMLPKHCDAKFQNSRFFSWRFFSTAVKDWQLQLRLFHFRMAWDVTPLFLQLSLLCGFLQKMWKIHQKKCF